MKENSLKLLSSYVTLLKAAYEVHQRNHWLCAGYGNHQLFQRLYEDIAQAIDEAGEKTVSIFGDLKEEEGASDIAKQYSPEGEHTGLRGYLESSLAIEEKLQELGERVYNELKEAGDMTLGLDDMIMSQASGGETRVYLLRQALKRFESKLANMVNTFCKLAISRDR